MTMFDEDQFVIELINRARANPTAEAARLGIDLNEDLPPGTLSASPKPPLAPHQSLLDAAAAHSQDMIDRNFFDHENPDGDGPAERIADAGYVARSWAENIAIHVDAAEAHEALFRSAGHRQNMLLDTYREVGVGVRERNDWGVNMTETFASRTGQAFLTGVAFFDQIIADRFFTAGEGLANVTITATARTSGASYTTNTSPTGGYSLQVPSDTYDLTAAGGELSKPIAVSGISLGTANVKIDFVVPHVEPGPLIANDDRTMTEKEAVVAIDVLANDSPLPSAVVAIVSPPSGGHVSVDGTTGRVAYTPATGRTGPDEFTYRFQNSGGDWSPVARVVVAVVDPAGQPWQNPLLAADVNADHRASALDALILITNLNAYQDRILLPPSVEADFPPAYWDVSGDGRLDAQDVLGVINYINYGSPVAAAEGEASGSGGKIQAAPVPTASPSRWNTSDDALGASAGSASSAPDLDARRWPAATPDGRRDLPRHADHRRRISSEDFDRRALVEDDVPASGDLLQAIDAIACR
jgi:hypothetical protein